MRLHSLDLNLLIALRALLDERHVTRAGQSVGLSQPAMSDALAKLRRHFGDELLLRHGTQYDLTPLGLLLRDRVAESLDSVERTFRIRGDFDPTTSDRTFTLIAGSNGLAVFVKPLMDRLRDAGPGIRVRVRDLHSFGELEPALRAADGLLAPRGFLSGYPAMDLYQDEWVCLRAADRDVKGGPLTLEELAERPWVLAHDQRRAQNPVVRYLAALGMEPRVELLIEDFLGLPPMVAHTDRIAVLPSRLAAWFGAYEALDFSPLPVPVPPLTEAFWWHPAHSRDAGHVWFRRLVSSTSQTLAE
ncbi:LysR family transcriptional regulator [Streptomyces sp. NPDC002643]